MEDLNMNMQTTQSRMYRSAISECDLSFCTHFNEERRRCSLRKCFYDRSNALDELNVIEKKRRVEELNGEPSMEALRWDG
jgi:hypothetical protein